LVLVNEKESQANATAVAHKLELTSRLYVAFKEENGGWFVEEWYRISSVQSVVRRRLGSVSTGINSLASQVIV